MKQKLSIAIVTKNRGDKLRRCLKSISRQSLSPYRVIVVDNDKERSAKRVALSFKKNMNIDYEPEPRQGVAHARNRALLLCTTPFLGFVDDDCVLDKKWVQTGSDSISKTKAAYVLGKSLLYNPESVVALAQYYYQNYWFNKRLMEVKDKISPFSFDTKNIIIKISRFKKKGLKFDPKLSLQKIDSSDTDMGLQLEELVDFGVYEPKMIVYHEELANLLPYLRKAYRRGKLALILAEKWNLEREVVDLGLISWSNYLKSLRLWKAQFNSYTVEQKENTIKKILAFLLLKTYERVHLQGYAGQAKILGVKLEK